MILAYICSDFIFIIRKLIALIKIYKQRYINLPKSNEDKLNYISTNDKQPQSERQATAKQQ